MLKLPFLGHTVQISAAPFALALSSGAPLLVVFAVKLGPWHYRFSCDAPRFLTAAQPADRSKVMEEAAMAYLQRVHEMMKAHPEQWQNFGEFLRRDSESPVPT